MKDKMSNQLNGHFEIDTSYDNPTWLKTSIRAVGFGRNNNNSDINKSSMSEFSRANKSIGGIPIVARYNADNDDLEGHNVILRKNKDEEYEMFHDTDPFGFTSPNTTFHYEDVNEGTDEFPDYRTYIVIDDVYLWKRFEATRKILQWSDDGIPTSVSVEIENIDGEFKDGSFSIKDFNFSGVCALGSTVAPCFDKAQINLYSKDEFKNDMKELIFELTNSDDSTSKENSQPENNTPSKQNTNTQETGGQQVMSKDTNLNFELTHQQLSMKLRQSLQVHRFVDKEGQSARRYWYQDHTNTKVIYEDLSEAGQLYESPFRTNGNDVTIDLADRVQASLAFIPQGRNDYNLKEELDKAQAKITEFEATLTAKDEEVEETVESLKTKHAEEFETLKTEHAETVEGMKSDLAKLAEKSTEFETVQAEVVELRGFKRGAELADVKAKFSGKLEDKSLDAILEASADKAVEALEAEIFAEIGKQNFSLVQDVQVNKPSVQFSHNVSTKDDGYNGLFNQFSK